jgi:mannose-6-phosphate isomerase-like protein (cupin superfamily)
VVTGHDKNGNSVVLADDFAPVTNRDRRPRPNRRTTDLWLTRGLPVIVSGDEGDPTLDPNAFVIENGTKLRINEFEPEPPEIRRLPVEQAIARMNAENGAAPKTLTREQSMHRTRTVDYAIVLEGEMTLYVGDKEMVLKAGDVVIQRGTKHAWRNRSDKRVRMLYVLLDARFAPELQKQIESESH